MPKPSNQLLFSAAASVLALAALALSAPSIGEGSRSGAGLIPVEASIEFPHLPGLPSILPR